MNKGISVHARDECICGQVHEVIYHLSDGGFDVRTQWPKLEPIREGSFSAHIEAKPERTLEFSGKYGVVELNGVRWDKSEGCVCVKCGMNLIYGLVTEEGESE